MKCGGQEIYVRPFGLHYCHLIKYFESIKGVKKIKDGYNPATWMLEITTSMEEIALGVDFTTIYKNSELYRRNKTIIEQLSKPPPSSKDIYFPSQYSQSFFIQCMACFLWKQHWSYWRNPPYTAARMLFTVVVALTFGTMFWDRGSKIEKQQNLFNVMGSMYAAIVFLGLQTVSYVQPVVDVERTVFYRERAAGMYSASSYALAQAVIELPYGFVQAAVYSVIVYSMIGFEWTAAKYFWYIFFTYFTLMYYTYFGMMSVVLTPNHKIASVVSIAFHALWNLFLRFPIPGPRIPIWWRWYYWACPMAWTTYGLVASQFGDVIKDMLDTGLTVEAFTTCYFAYKHDFLAELAVGVVGFAALFACIFGFAIMVLNF
ncbi:pleiotropic drug resistance protein 1-like [Carya illinoinensis]|uniref:pleiotropic drug resistance protein 1-like n=1 Tax=Carya illinoinensis TaxID=32201 RepID=UPI001C71EECB|nr:pleiotropic drug resistance protein 1-like [Carya illinoinensis]